MDELVRALERDRARDSARGSGGRPRPPMMMRAWGHAGGGFPGAAADGAPGPRMSSASSTESEPSESESEDERGGQLPRDPTRYDEDDDDDDESMSGLDVPLSALESRKGATKLGKRKVHADEVESGDSDGTLSEYDARFNVDDEVNRLENALEPATWRDAVIAGWRILSAAHAYRSSFSRNEITTHARRVWVALFGKQSLNKKWRYSAVRALNDETAFRHSNELDYVLVDSGIRDQAAALAKAAANGDAPFPQQPTEPSPRMHRARGRGPRPLPESSPVSVSVKLDERVYGWVRGEKIPPTWRDTAVAAFMELKILHPKRSSFAIAEITDYVSANWGRISWSHHRRAQWRGILRQEIRVGKYKGVRIFLEVSDSPRPDSFAFHEGSLLELPGPVNKGGKRGACMPTGGALLELPRGDSRVTAPAEASRPPSRLVHPKKALYNRLPPSEALTNKPEARRYEVGTGKVGTARPLSLPGSNRAYATSPSFRTGKWPASSHGHASTSLSHSLPFRPQSHGSCPQTANFAAAAHETKAVGRSGEGNPYSHLDDANLQYVQLQTRKSTQPRSNLPKGATEILRNWAATHAGHPYPSEEEKHALAAETGTTINQIQNWFINHRKRVWKPASKETAVKSFSLKARALSGAEKTDSESRPASVQKRPAGKREGVPSSSYGMKYVRQNSFDTSGQSIVGRPVSALQGPSGRDCAGLDDEGWRTVPIGSGLVKFVSAGILPKSSLSRESHYAHGLDVFSKTRGFVELQRELAEFKTGEQLSGPKFEVLDKRLSMHIMDTFDGDPSDRGYVHCLDILFCLESFHPPLRDKLPYSRSAVKAWSALFGGVRS